MAEQVLRGDRGPQTALLSRCGALSARRRPGQGRPAGAAARPGFARSWTRPPARTGWQLGGKAAGRGPAAASAGIVGWAAGPGVAFPKSWCWGCEPAALVSESFPRFPPGLLALAARRASAW